MKKSLFYLAIAMFIPLLTVASNDDFNREVDTDDISRYVKKQLDLGVAPIVFGASWWLTEKFFLKKLQHCHTLLKENQFPDYYIGKKSLYEDLRECSTIIHKITDHSKNSRHKKVEVTRTYLDKYKNHIEKRIIPLKEAIDKEIREKEASDISIKKNKNMTLLFLADKKEFDSHSAQLINECAGSILRNETKTFSKTFLTDCSTLFIALSAYYKHPLINKPELNDAALYLHSQLNFNGKNVFEPRVAHKDLEVLHTQASEFFNNLQKNRVRVILSKKIMK